MLRGMKIGTVRADRGVAPPSVGLLEESPRGVIPSKGMAKRSDSERASAGTLTAVERVAGALRLAVIVAKVPLREIDRRLEWNENDTADILRLAATKMKMWHVFEVLRALDIPPAKFFGELFGLRDPWKESEPTAHPRSPSMPALNPARDLAPSIERSARGAAILDTTVADDEREGHAPRKPAKRKGSK